MKKDWELRLLSLEKKRLWKDLIAAFQYFKEAFRKDEENFFTRTCSDKRRCKDFKLKENRFRLDIWKKL